MEQTSKTYTTLTNNNWTVLLVITNEAATSKDETIENDLNDNELETDEIQKLSDLALIKRFVTNREENVWEEFYRRFNPNIKCYIKKLTNFYESKLHQQTFLSLREDLAQEVYLKLLRNDCQSLKAYLGKNHCFYAYLYKIVLNTILDSFRKNKQRQNNCLSLENILDDKSNQEGLNTLKLKSKLSYYSNIPANCEIDDLLTKTLADQTKRNTKIFFSYTHLGMKSSEIIQKFNLNLSTDGIESIVRRLRRKMSNLKFNYLSPNLS